MLKFASIFTLQGLCIIAWLLVGHVLNHPMQTGYLHYIAAALLPVGGFFLGLASGIGREVQS